MRTAPRRVFFGGVRPDMPKWSSLGPFGQNGLKFGGCPGKAPRAEGRNGRKPPPVSKWPSTPDQRVGGFWDGLFVNIYQKRFPFRASGRSRSGYFFVCRPLLFSSMCFGTSLGLLWHPFGSLLVFLLPCRISLGIGNLPFRHPNL